MKVASRSRLCNDQPASHTKFRTLPVGELPNSNYPAAIDIGDLALHHCAILGVTGSGKSFTAFDLIEGCAAKGIKILCLDVTGDYQRYLSGVRLAKPSDIPHFLDDGTTSIGIVEFSNSAVHPIVTTRDISKAVLAWCRSKRAEGEIREPRPKVMIVLEEAHSLVPEWNMSPQKDHQDKVNETAQIVLQARKYGLGFMVITQRTANVTKSILNQCNTVFAFQAHDETGFDFMKNYMGTHYVQALPTLRKRHGVLVGKASRSDRPLIVRFTDQNRVPATQTMPLYTVPTPTVPAQPGPTS